jgi:hypothetical protein
VLSALYALTSCGLCEVSMHDARQRSRVNSKVSFRKKPVGVAPPIAPTARAPAPARVAPREPEAPTPRVSETFDLSAALSAELGDEPLPFELEPPRAVVAREPEPEPEPEPDDDELDQRTTNVIDVPMFDESVVEATSLPAEPPAQAAANDDSRAIRKAKRTQQLLAFVAVPRAPARKP